MTIDVRADGEVIILLAVHPDAIIVAIVDSRLEKGRHIALVGGVALVVLANAPPLLALVYAGFTRLPEIGVAADGVMAGDIALDGEGIAVHQGHVTIRSPSAREETFEFGAAGARVSFRADVHGAAGGVAMRYADLAAG